MRKSLIVVASALLFGVGAADVSNPKLGYDDQVYAGLVHPDDLRPRPARHNYPACRPGRGDDRCIQLYEGGVRERLARWNRPTGGWSGEVRMARAERRERWRARQHQRRMHERAAMHRERHPEPPVAMHRERHIDDGRMQHRRIEVRRIEGAPHPRHGVRIREGHTPELMDFDRRAYERRRHERSVHGERTGTPGI